MSDLIDRFRTAITEIESRFGDGRLDDSNVEAELRMWLDGDDSPLPWAHEYRVTADEWFFITTLYGEMTIDGQRTHIRKFFPSLFVAAAGRDTRNFVAGMPEYAGLRSAWMPRRLWRMGEVLRERRQAMSGYTSQLRELERSATPDDPMPALGALVADQRATGWKTLSVFVRDCVGGNCFPIDTRVQRELERHGLPTDERRLVSCSLALGRNPRQLARVSRERAGEPRTRRVSRDQRRCA